MYSYFHFEHQFVNLILKKSIHKTSLFSCNIVAFIIIAELRRKGKFQLLFNDINYMHAELFVSAKFFVYFKSVDWLVLSIRISVKIEWFGRTAIIRNSLLRKPPAFLHEPISVRVGNNFLYYSVNFGKYS